MRASFHVVRVVLEVVAGLALIALGAILVLAACGLLPPHFPR